MPLKKLALPALTFAVAAALSVVAAGFASGVVEDSSVEGVRQALEAEGLDWADADANGLQVYLIGTAPSEAARFKALSVAGGVVDSARVIDELNVEETADLAPPRFSIEILRNESGISLIGLIPAGSDRDALMGTVNQLAGSDNVADLLETADFPAPDGWEEAVGYALISLKSLPRSKISVEAERVAITAMTESPEEKRETEARLGKSVPDGVRLALDISAPRPVITPFTLHFTIDEARGARFDACSADTEETRARILKAARAAGAEGDPTCRLGLGVPSKTWGQAVELAIEALAEMGGGSVTFSDADIRLVALQGTGQGHFDTVAGELEAALPDVFALNAVLPAPETQAEDQGPAEFTATLSPEGSVQLRGRVAGEVARQTADSYAKARFGSDVVHTATRLDEGLPEDWSVRVLAALEALSWLKNGAATVTEDEVAVRGNTGHKEASDEIATLLADKLGEESGSFSIDVVYQEKLDPIASQPTPEECQRGIVNIIGERKINFEPGSAKLDREGQGIMDDIADLLKQCGDLRLEIQGHTDSQGREVMNQQLSQARAQTVLEELRKRRVLTASFTAKGYGEAEPIAENDTEEGREANRRIEFELIRPEPVKEEPTTLESTAEPVEEGGGEAGAAAGGSDGTDEQN